MANRPEAEPLPQVAYYYPEPYWRDSSWIKNLILFFDGVAALVPDYMKETLDNETVGELKKFGLFHRLLPETVVDKSVTEEMLTVVDGLIESGILDALRDRKSPFAAISKSRLGFMGDETLARFVHESLKKKGLAADSQDGKSIPMDTHVRSLVLVLLAQIIRTRGPSMGFDLSPATDQPKVITSLREFLSQPQLPTAGHVVSFDLQQVGVDLSDVPIIEVLSFRTENHTNYRQYLSKVRKFVRDMSSIQGETDRRLEFEERKREIDQLQADLTAHARKALKRKLVFSLGLVGTAFGVGASAGGMNVGTEAAAVASAGLATLGLLRLLGIVAGGFESDTPDLGAYSYLFKAKDTFAH